MKSKQISSFKESEIGRIPKDWQVLRLEDISQKITDGSHFSPREIGIGNKIIATVKDMRYNGFVFEECKKISDDDFNLLVNNGCEPEQGDILISKDGANCLDLIFVYEQDTRIVLLSSVAIVRLKKGFNPWFYRSYLLSPLTQKIMKGGYVSGSAIPRVILSDFKKIPVPVPPYEIQNKVAKTLKGFDDRIIALKKSNSVLEEIVKLIFKSWFVDFDGQTELIDSELGLIPKNWIISTIGSKLVTKSGGTPSKNVKSYWENGNISWINSGKMRDFRITEPVACITEKAKINSSTKLVPKYTTVMAITGATLGEISFLEIDSCISQNVVAILPSKKIFSEFIYFWINQNMVELISARSGGAQQHINKKIIDDSLLLIPDDTTLGRFQKISNPIFRNISSTCFEINKLEKMKIYLLPKLMSGEI